MSKSTREREREKVERKLDTDCSGDQSGKNIKKTNSSRTCEIKYLKVRYNITTKK